MVFLNSLAFPVIQRMLAIWSLVPMHFLKPMCYGPWRCKVSTQLSNWIELEGINILRMRWLNNIPNSMDINLSKLQDIMEGRGVQHAAVHGAAKNWTQLSHWKTTTTLFERWHRMRYCSSCSVKRKMCEEDLYPIRQLWRKKSEDYHQI